MGRSGFLEVEGLSAGGSGGGGRGEKRGGQHSRPVPTSALSRPCFWSKLRVEDLRQEGSSWGLRLPSLPTAPTPGTRKPGPVPSAASGQLASALFLEALSGDCPLLSSEPSCRKALPGVFPDLSRCSELL